MADDFRARAEHALHNAPDDATVVVAVVTAGGALVMQTRSDHPHHLARIAASLAGEAAERIDMAGDVLDGAEQAGLLIACQDAETMLREALDAGEAAP